MTARTKVRATQFAPARPYRKRKLPITRSRSGKAVFCYFAWYLPLKTWVRLSLKSFSFHAGVSHWLCHSDARQVYDSPSPLHSNRSMTVQVGDLKRKRIGSRQVEDLPRIGVAEPLDWSVGNRSKSVPGNPIKIQSAYIPAAVKRTCTQTYSSV